MKIRRAEQALPRAIGVWAKRALPSAILFSAKKLRPSGKALWPALLLAGLALVCAAGLLALWGRGERRPERGPDACDHLIGLEVSKADGSENYAAVAPGDTVCLAAGTRPPLKLENFRGEPGKPIVFINSGGRVIIQGSRDDYAGIHIRRSEYIRLTGAGLSEQCGAPYRAGEQQCGLVVRGASRGVVGADRTRYIEIDHLEIQDTSKMGITIKSKDKNGVNRAEWTQYDTYLHHNYLRDIGTEGLYLGSSFYNKGQDPLLEGVEVSHNLIMRTGWDGLQVGSAVRDCTIHHNRIIQASQANESSQRSGIMNNRGSVCHIYNNYIIDSVSRGIYIQGNGGNRVYNNVIVRPGWWKDAGREETKGDGIVVIRGSNQGQSVYIWNNTIVEPRRSGIRFRNDQGDNNLIQNNLIVGPGDRAGKGAAAYIDIKDLSNVAVSNNLYKPTVVEVGFKAPKADDYALLPDSPAVDAGLDLSWAGVTTDYAGVARSQGQGPDIGAFEYAPSAR